MFGGAPAALGLATVAPMWRSRWSLENVAPPAPSVFQWRLEGAGALLGAPTVSTVSNRTKARGAGAPGAMPNTA
jgi:hypothetical protein